MTGCHIRHAIPSLRRCDARFLEANNNPDDREYSKAADPIRESLIHANYLSRKDIEICAAFDIADEFDVHLNFLGIESLHQTLRSTYTDPEATAAT